MLPALAPSLKLVQQDVKLPINEVYELKGISGKEKWRKHGNLLPSSIRALFCGSSNCGKTNALMNLIYNPNGLAFENIYVYSKSLYQPKYQQLENILSMIPEIGYFPFTDNESVIPPDEAKENSLFIFDDVACEKQSCIRSYYSMGRHRNVDSFYLIQTYSSAPKQMVRDNLNLILVFKQDFRNLKHIYFDHVNTDMSFNDFSEMCKYCWNARPYGALLIDKTSDMNNGRYRLGFDQYIMQA